MYGDLSSYDVFNFELLHGASYAGTIELPVLQSTSYLPDILIPFSRARASRTDLSGSCIHFYEHDAKFRCVWSNPRRYLPLFQRAGAAIGPDFSMYRCMPAAMQQWSCFQSRAISFWLQQNGVEVVPNVRFSDDRSWEYCFDGLPKHSVLAVGSHGCLRCRDDRSWFRLGLVELVRHLDPRVLVVYGSAPDDVFGFCRESGIEVIPFASEFACAHEGAPHGNR